MRWGDLKSIDLSDNVLGDEGARVICQSHCWNVGKLESINLTCNGIFEGTSKVLKEEIPAGVKVHLFDDSVFEIDEQTNEQFDKDFAEGVKVPLFEICQSVAAKALSQTPSVS